jgi:hypothetical protein
MTTMDLWYDLAIRERPDLDATVIDPGEAKDAEELAPEVEASRPVAVDFF